MEATKKPEARRYPNVKPIAYYLPQFHAVPENDEWWGTGFTEWRSCTTARPLFPGHAQPKLPGDMGFYDLLSPDVQRRQAAKAKEYGIQGFCHYFYWFDGRRILEQPTEILLANKDIDIEFCLCWANEPWSRRWDGQERDVLLPQEYDPSTFDAFADELLKYFADDRYIKVEGKPIFLIYRSDHVQYMDQLVSTLRTRVEAAGFPGVYLMAAETFVDYGAWNDPRDLGLDAAVEFPPHATNSDWIPAHTLTSDAFTGNIFDMLTTYINSMLRPDPDYKLYRCLFPGWDNTARRDAAANIFVGQSPELYAHWLDHQCQWTQRNHEPEHQLLFINAWNEWAEGAYLEPDILNGHDYLNATRDVLNGEFQLEFPVSSQNISKFDKDEKAAFYTEYYALTSPKLGYKAQLAKPFEPRFRVPERLYQHNYGNVSQMPIAVTQEHLDDFAASQSIKIRAIAAVNRVRYAIGHVPGLTVRYLRVERPVTFTQRVRRGTYLGLRTVYRVLRGRPIR